MAATDKQSRGHPGLSKNPAVAGKDAGKASAIASFYPSILYLLQFVFSSFCGPLALFAFTTK